MDEVSVVSIRMNKNKLLALQVNGLSEREEKCKFLTASTNFFFLLIFFSPWRFHDGIQWEQKHVTPVQNTQSVCKTGNHIIRWWWKWWLHVTLWKMWCWVNEHIKQYYTETEHILHEPLQTKWIATTKITSKCKSKIVECANSVNKYSESASRLSNVSAASKLIKKSVQLCSHDEWTLHTTRLLHVNDLRIAVQWVALLIEFNRSG